MNRGVSLVNVGFLTANNVKAYIYKQGTVNFYVLLTMHFRVTLDNDRLDAHLLYFTIRLLNPLHVSSIICSSSGG